MNPNASLDEGLEGTWARWRLRHEHRDDSRRQTAAPCTLDQRAFLGPDMWSNTELPETLGYPSGLLTDLPDRHPIRDSATGGIRRVCHARPSQVRDRPRITVRRSVASARPRSLLRDGCRCEVGMGAFRCATLNAPSKLLRGRSRFAASGRNHVAVIELQGQGVGGEPSPSRAIPRASCEQQHRHESRAEPG